MKNELSLQPRLIRLKLAYAYLGMAERTFNEQVRPFVNELRIGKQGIAFDRLDLDNWVEHYKQRGQCVDLSKDCHSSKRTELWQKNDYQDSSNEATPGTLTKKSSDNAFAKAVERATSKKRKTF